MASEINRVAIMRGNYALESRFYESMFGMRSSPKARLAKASSVRPAVPHRFSELSRAKLLKFCAAGFAEMANEID
jgi:hypothetical protein